MSWQRGKEESGEEDRGERRRGAGRRGVRGGEQPTEAEQQNLQNVKR